MPTQCRPGHPASPGGTWLAFWLLLFLLVLPVAGLAQSPQPVPALQARIMDQTGTLDADQMARIEERLAGFERERGTQVVVLMVASTGPEDITDFTQRLGDEWKVGRAGIGDGLLFVIAKDDRRMRIAPAKTLEGAIPDILARRILDGVVAPAFRRGDYAAGIEAGLDQILARIAGEALPLPEDGGSAPDTDTPLADLLIFLVFAIPLFSTVLRQVFGKRIGTLLTGVGAGGMAWFITQVLWIAIGAGLLGMVAALFMLQLPGAIQRGRSGRNGPWGGPPGGWGGGGGWSDGGGGFSSGGGGDFGGGGASGSW